MSSASLNVSNFVTFMLRPENYPLWREQVLALAESQKLIDFLTGEKPCPAVVLPALDALLQKRHSAMLLVLIPLHKFGQHSRKRMRYAQSSQERQLQLNQQLTYMKKTQEVPLNEYIRKFKEVCDNLAAIRHMVADKNKVFSLLTGLGARYEPFTTSMLKPPMLSYNEVIPLLQSYETRLNLHSPESSQYTAFYADKNVPKYAPKNPKPTNNFSSKGRGFIPANQPNKNFSNSSSSNASHRENHRDITYNLPQAFTALQLNSKAHHEEWTSDTNASAHMTSNEGNLYNLRPYTGNDHVMLGNGEFLKVTHIGDALLGFGQSTTVLRNVLLIPELERSLLSIGQLTSDYSVTCEFSNNDFVIKDKLTQQVLMRGLKRGNLYAIRAPPVALFSSRFRVASEDISHQRLGHVQAAAVAHLRNKALIRTIYNKDNSIYESCQLGKLSKLSFSLSESKTFAPFEKVHIDLWGPAPLTSLHQFRFMLL
ncbi:hypothetical protein Pint_23230 [Pistacia integerrima]|uniref:Uncharacterized protein n=1 Tax=Pistacia integerrima TaxID=434235 RepID=A0ACC0YQC3_9ROSI|nr:hypothetical protein Pint_23230 [Pistacia integerrima]